jgi:hypothetical protein
MQVYQTDHNGFYVGLTIADADPLDGGNWLVPAGCVTDEPPALGEGQRAQFFNGAWVVVDPEPVVEPEPEPEFPPTKAEQEAKRQAAYTAESDPLFFKWQAGEATEEDWLAKRQEIRDRYPYPAE